MLLDMLPEQCQRCWRAVLSCCVVLVLILNLSACSAEGDPPRQQLLQALTLQIQLTQSAVSRSLQLPEISSNPSVSRVRVEQLDHVSVGENRGVKVTGRFDWQLPGDRMQVDSPVQIYLERGEHGESWRLARPSGSSDGLSQDWLTYPLPLG